VVIERFSDRRVNSPPGAFMTEVRMFKRVLWLLALGLAMMIPSARLLAAEEGGAAHGHEGPEYGLMPNFQDKEQSTQALYSSLWVLIIFIVLLAILYPTAWRNVLAGLKKREERIRNDIAEAEAARGKAETLLKQYNEQLAAAEARSREMIAAATSQGENLATQIRMKAQQEAEEVKERATRDIEAARDAAVREVHNQAAVLSTMIAEKILRRNINAADQADLVRESLDQLQSVEH
jgi:F-type H+-transporting ATPase subunit b